MRDPVELEPPNGDCFLVILRMEKSSDCIPSAPFEDFLLDLRYSSATKNIVSELSKPFATGLTHIANRVIASHTD